MGRRGPPLRDPAGSVRLRCPRRRRRRRDDDAADGATLARDRGAGLRPRRGHAADQHRPRRRRGRPRRAALSAGFVAARRRHRPGCVAGQAGFHGRDRGDRPAPAGCRRRAVRPRHPRHRQPAIVRAGLASMLARALYAEIGRELERGGLDSISRRAVVSSNRKLAVAARMLALPGRLWAPARKPAADGPARRDPYS